jgi:hypothetical protein
MEPKMSLLFWRHDSSSHGSSSVGVIVLLLIAAIAGDSALVSTLRGNPVDDEGRRSRTVGYYETLLDAPLDGFLRQAPQPPRGWIAFGAPQADIVVESPTYLRWEMHPELDIRWNGTVFRTNRHGYRTPEVELKKRDGTYRIVVFGSSNTMGYGVDNDDIYTRRLERWLSEHVGPGLRVEVVNLAVAGDSPTRRLARMEQEAGRWQADWLLCDASVLDGWLEDSHIQWVVTNQIAIPYPFVGEAVKRAKVTPTDSIDVFREKFQGESERMLADVYARWNAVARRHNVPLTVVILPRADAKAKSPRVTNLIRSLAVQSGLDCLDLSDAFDRLSVDEFRVSEWDKHPSTRGHLAIFEALRAQLFERGGPPGLALSSSRSGASVARR